jgi:hypothetical protein
MKTRVKKEGESEEAELGRTSNSEPPSRTSDVGRGSSLRLLARLRFRFAPARHVTKQVVLVSVKGPELPPPYAEGSG